MRFGWIRIHYLLLYSVVGAYLVYSPLYLRQRGLSDAQIGWVIGVYGVAVLLMPAIMAHMADRRIANRTLIGIGYAVTTASLMLLWSSTEFAWLLVASLMFSVAYTPNFSLLDGLNFGTMHDAEEAGLSPPPYHRTRLWGSVGFMLPAGVIYLILSKPGDVRPAILLAAGCALVAAITSLWLPVPKRRDDKTSSEERPALPSARAWQEIKRPPVRVFVISMLLMFLAISIFYGFYSRYLQHIGVAERWAGLIMNIGVVVEIVIILFSGRILRWIGLRGVLIVGAVSMTVRMALLACFDIPAVAIASQVLHGPTVLAIYILPPMYLNHKASPAFRNSMQGLYGALCFGVARVIGSVTGGHLAEIGLRHAFTLAAALSGAALLLLVLRFRDDEACEAIEQRVSSGQPQPSQPTPAEPQLPDP